jgi:hypothetical protein
MLLLSQAHTLSVTLQNEELAALHSLSSLQAPPIPAIKCRKLLKYCYFSYKSYFKKGLLKVVVFILTTCLKLKGRASLLK